MLFKDSSDPLCGAENRNVRFMQESKITKTC